jgi:hypothetical protein
MHIWGTPQAHLGHKPEHISGKKHISGTPRAHLVPQLVLLEVCPRCAFCPRCARGVLQVVLHEMCPRCAPDLHRRITELPCQFTLTLTFRGRFITDNLNMKHSLQGTMFSFLTLRRQCLGVLLPLATVVQCPQLKLAVFASKNENRLSYILLF